MARLAASREPAASWRGVLLILLVLAGILYLSLWPFRWQALPPGTALGPLLAERLLHAPIGGRGDLMANLLLYLPLGLLGGVLLPLQWPRSLRLLLPALAGALLSAAVETLQLLLPGRVASGNDLALNALGALAGAALALAAGGRAVLAPRGRLADPLAALLVLAWLGARLYPYLPVIDLQAWKDNLKPLLLYPALEPPRLAALLAGWTSAALLAEVAAGAAAAQLLVPLGLLAALAAEAVIPGKALTLAEALAIGGALPAWALLRGRVAAPWVMAAAMLLALLAERLAPFAFVGPPRPFTWIPFASLVGGSLGAGAQAILGKLFLNGALLFWLQRCGLRLGPAVLLQAAIVLGASYAQRWLPGRSAEIGDTLLVLGLGLAFLLLRRPDAARWRAPAAAGAAA